MDKQPVEEIVRTLVSTAFHLFNGSMEIPAEKFNTRWIKDAEGVLEHIPDDVMRSVSHPVYWVLCPADKSGPIVLEKAKKDSEQDRYRLVGRVSEDEMRTLTDRIIQKYDETLCSRLNQ